MTKLPVFVSVFYFFYFAIIGSIVIYMPNMLSLYNYSSIEIGILFSIIPLVRFISPFLFLKKIKLDFFIIKISIIVNLISIIAIFFVLKSLYSIALVLFLYGMSINQFIPYVETIAIKYLKEEKYGKTRLFGSIGFMVVALIVPYFSSHILMPLYVMLISSVLMYVFTIAIHLNIKKDIKKTTIKNIDKFSLVKIWPFWIAILLIQFSFGGMYNFFTIYLLDNDISISIVSYLWTFSVICEIIILYYQRHILKRYSLIDIMKFSMLITSLRWAITFIYPDSKMALIIAQSFHAFSFALFHSACIFYLSTKYKNKELAQLFYMGISFGLGAFLGASFAGLFYGTWLFLYESIIAFMAFLLFSNAMQNKFKKYF